MLYSKAFPNEIKNAIAKTTKIMPNNKVNNPNDSPAIAIPLPLFFNPTLPSTIAKIENSKPTMGATKNNGIDNKPETNEVDPKGNP